MHEKVRFIPKNMFINIKKDLLGIEKCPNFASVILNTIFLP